MLKEDTEKLARFLPGKYAFGRSISILHRFTQRFIDNELKGYNINKAQMEVMIILLKSVEEVNLTKINEFFGYNKATVSKLIKHLENEKYVKRTTSKNDKREKIISLTDKGQAVGPTIMEAISKEDEILNSMLDAKSSDLVREMLFQMSEHVKETIINRP